MDGYHADKGGGPREWNAQRHTVLQFLTIRVTLYNRQRRGTDEEAAGAVSRRSDSKDRAGPIGEFGLCPEDSEEPQKRERRLAAAGRIEWRVRWSVVGCRGRPVGRPIC